MGNSILLQGDGFSVFIVVFLHMKKGSRDRELHRNKYSAINMADCLNPKLIRFKKE